MCLFAINKTVCYYRWNKDNNRQFFEKGQKVAFILPIFYKLGFHPAE